MFTCVGWQVTLCDPIWQVTFRSCVMGYVTLTAMQYLLPLQPHGLMMKCDFAFVAEIRQYVCRRTGIGDTQRRPDVVSTGHAQRRRTGRAICRRPHPGVSVVIATVLVSAAMRCFQYLRRHRNFRNENCGINWWGMKIPGVHILPPLI